MKNWISAAKISKKCNFKKWTKNSSRSLNPQFLVMGNLSLKIWNFKANFRGGNQLKITMVKKTLSSRCKLRKVFNFFFFFKKILFYVQKYEKNWKSKNGVWTALTTLFKELWAIYVFFTNFKFNDFQKHQRKCKH